MSTREAGEQTAPTADTLHTDVVILGSGLAGLTLARHLLLYTDKRVTIVERYLDGEHNRERQKYGESTVQLSGWYFGKVLDLTEELLKNHYIKYNLRFYWPTPGCDPTRFENYCQSYLTTFSNIATFQLDRNLMEKAVRTLNEANPRFTRIAPAKELTVELDPRGEHTVTFDGPQGRQTVAAHWLVDASGRNRVLAKKMGLQKKSPVRHGAAFAWVEGLVDIEKLTDAGLKEQRLASWHRHAGNSPLFLATNHFCDEGLWFWVIPLHDKTSLGLVFEHGVADLKDVASGEKLLEWACQRFPCFQHDLPKRKVLDFWALRDYAHDCVHTISEDRWAMTGEAGRFSDPLYSPGSDLIAIHNTLIVDAIKHDRRARCRQHESLARALYDAYIPGYDVGYWALGDQEAFNLKYVWELTVYFVAYVYPFMNDLFTDPAFVRPFLQRFTRLGPWNRGLQELFKGFTHWKQKNGGAGGGNGSGEPQYYEFSKLGPLDKSRELFFEIGVGPEEALAALDPHFARLEEMARFMAAHITARVAGAPPEAVHRKAFVESIDMQDLRFDPAAMTALWAAARDDRRPHEWSFCTRSLDPYWPELAEPARQAAG